MFKKNILFFCLLLLFCRAPAQTAAGRMVKYEQDLLAHPKDYSKYQNLAFLISHQFSELSPKERIEIRNFLADHTKFSEIHINPPQEPGIPITIRGIVYNARGVALKNVRLLVFHTDASGYYTPDDIIKKTMNEPDARLFGYITTNDSGWYSFTTIHPGSYPNKYEGRFIPQHIHFEIKHPGYKNFSIQMAFEDDPAMKDLYWKKWAADLHFPVIRFVKETGRLIGRYNIHLENK